MAILPDAADCVATTLVGTYQGALFNNTLHFHAEAPLGTGITSTHLDTFNTSISSAWSTNLAALMNPLAILTDVNSILLTTRTSPTAYSHLATPVPGTRTGTPPPTSAAVCVSWHINRRYRGGHGRIYLPAANTTDITNGRTLAGAFVISANTAVAAFQAALENLSLNSVPMNFVVLSYYESTPDTSRPKPVPPGGYYNHSTLRSTPVPFIITSAKVRTRLDTQRRRLGKETT